LFASLSANHEAAVRAASQAAARADGTQFLPLRSHPHWTRALALYHAGRPDQAVRARETARVLALAKGDLAFTTQIRLQAGVSRIDRGVGPSQGQQAGPARRRHQTSTGSYAAGL
jgi:hypothetical protein